MFKWLEIEAFRYLRQKLKISFDEPMLDNQTAHFLHSFRKTVETIFCKKFEVGRLVKSQYFSMKFGEIKVQYVLYHVPKFQSKTILGGL